MSARGVVRCAVNAVTLATPLGLAIAAVGRCRLRRGPDGLVLAGGYRLAVPAAMAFTVGNVVLTRLSAAELLDQPRLLAHEGRHATQYATLLGLPFLLAYGLAAAWSWWRAGDPATRNIFEIGAGLADGGYPPLGRTRSRGG